MMADATTTLSKKASRIVVDVQQPCRMSENSKSYTQQPTVA
jgi:hypothetical protein